MSKKVNKKAENKSAKENNNKRNKNKRNKLKAKRSQSLMLVQHFKSEYFIPFWSGKKNKNYSDKEICSQSEVFFDSNKSKKAVASNYLATLYHNAVMYYQKYNVKFMDYKKIFSQKDIRVKYNLIREHLVMRLCYFYFRDSLKNLKHARMNKRGKSNIKPPYLASILHDKDRYDNGSYKPPHIHIAMRFSKRVSTKQVGKWAGVNSQAVRTKGNSNQYGFANIVGYLTHEAVPKKHIYDWHKVWWNNPIWNYPKFRKKHISGWQEHRVNGSVTGIKGAHQALMLELDNPAKYHIYMQDILLDDKLRHAYGYHMSASAHRQLGYEAVNLLRAKKHDAHRFYMPVIYFSGANGTGKSYMCNQIILNLEKKLGCKSNDMGYTNTSPYVFRPATGINQFDDYGSQPIMDFDESRNTSVDTQTILELMDQSNSSLGARYHNKEFVMPRLLLINTIQPFGEFVGYSRSRAHNEEIGQFYRRVGLIVHTYRSKDRNPAHTKVRIYQVATVSRPENIMIGHNVIYEDTGASSKQPVFKKSTYCPYPNPQLVSMADKNYALGKSSKFHGYSHPMSESQAIKYISKIVWYMNDYKHHRRYIDDCFSSPVSSGFKGVVSDDEYRNGKVIDDADLPF